MDGAFQACAKSMPKRNEKNANWKKITPTTAASLPTVQWESVAEATTRSTWPRRNLRHRPAGAPGPRVGERIRHPRTPIPPSALPAQLGVFLAASFRRSPWTPYSACRARHRCREPILRQVHHLAHCRSADPARQRGRTQGLQHRLQRLPRDPVVSLRRGVPARRRLHLPAELTSASSVLAGKLSMRTRMFIDIAGILVSCRRCAGSP